MDSKIKYPGSVLFKEYTSWNYENIHATLDTVSLSLPRLEDTGLRFASVGPHIRFYGINLELVIELLQKEGEVQKVEFSGEHVGYIHSYEGIDARDDGKESFPITKYELELGNYPDRTSFKIKGVHGTGIPSSFFSRPAIQREDSFIVYFVVNNEDVDSLFGLSKKDEKVKRFLECKRLSKKLQD